MQKAHGFPLHLFCAILGPVPEIESNPSRVKTSLRGNMPTRTEPLLTVEEWVSALPADQELHVVEQS
jgi:hypothetical protein